MSKEVSSLESKSYWLKTGKRAHYPKLEKDVETEVAVVGAGIAGILTAYHLVQQGKKVALFERFSILNGTTGNTTAKLSAQHGLLYNSLIERYDAQRAKLFYEANMLGIQQIKEISEKLKLDSFVGNETVYTYTTDPKKVSSFKKEKEAYDQLGIDGDYLEETPLGFDIQAAISMHHQGIFHPVGFLNGVLTATAKQGLEVYENTLIKEMEQKKDKTIVLKSEDGRKVTCQYAVFATHYPQIEKDDHYEQLWARTTQALAYKTKMKLFDGAHISYDTPSVTLRTMEYYGEHYFLIGGQSHGTGDGYSDEARYEKIHELAQKLFPVKEPAFKWSTHDLMTGDHIPFIGQLHPEYTNAYTITGLNAWGLANSSVGALVLSDLIFGRKNPYTEMYDPFRKIPKLDQDEEEEKSSSKVSKVADTAVKNLKPGEMTKIEDDDEPMGIYKDEDGKVHYLDLRCTHVGCHLGLNDGDGTWDCPCHGSRFDKQGKVIYGPAMDDLKELDRP